MFFPGDNLATATSNSCRRWLWKVGLVAERFRERFVDCANVKIPKQCSKTALHEVEFLGDNVVFCNAEFGIDGASEFISEG